MHRLDGPVHALRDVHRSLPDDPREQMYDRTRPTHVDSLTARVETSLSGGGYVADVIEFTSLGGGVTDRSRAGCDPLADGHRHGNGVLSRPVERPTLPEQSSDRYLAQPAAAKLAGVDTRHIHRLRAEGKVRSYKTANVVMVNLGDLSRALKRELVAPPEAVTAGHVEARLSEIVSRLANIVALAEEIGEERGRDRERAAAAERERDSALAMMRDLLSRAGITLQSTG